MEDRSVRAERLRVANAEVPGSLERRLLISPRPRHVRKVACGVDLSIPVRVNGRARLVRRPTPVFVLTLSARPARRRKRNHPHYSL